MENERIEILKRLYSDFKKTEGQDTKMTLRQFCQNFEPFTLDDLKLILNSPCPEFSKN